MRRSVYILLAVFLVQVSGLRVLCAPSRTHTENCCPDCGKSSPPRSASLPECCIGSILYDQGSVTETPNSSDSPETAAHFAITPASPLAVWAAIYTPLRQSVLPSVSPPLSPLAQSCLLLI